MRIANDAVENGPVEEDERTRILRLAAEAMATWRPLDTVRTGVGLPVTTTPETES